MRKIKQGKKQGEKLHQKWVNITLNLYGRRQGMFAGKNGFKRWNVLKNIECRYTGLNPYSVEVTFQGLFLWFYIYI